MSRYLILGHEVSAAEGGFSAALAAPHAARHRPICLCKERRVEPPEMYVARLRQAFVLKRMPGTGSQHAPSCPSYEPLPEASGLGQVLGSAIREDPATGETTLKLDFALSKVSGRSVAPASGDEADSVSSHGTRLSLRGLLHYLWDQAELTRWHPGFAGKRSWATVRRHLLLAAENKTTGGRSLLARLYVPEVFSVEQRDAINARRVRQWSRFVAKPGGPRNLMLLIGEVKEIVPARYGFKSVVKHVPDQSFAMDEQLHRRLGRRFNAELMLWASAETAHMIMIATFTVGEAGVPSLIETSLMPVTEEWLPIEDTYERQLVSRLVAEHRRFVKGLRYNLGRNRSVACATLTDVGDAVRLLFVCPPGCDETPEVGESPEESSHCGTSNWVWRPHLEALPGLPVMSRPSTPTHARHDSADGSGHLSTVPSTANLGRL